jgi:radical SAM superfamily enzyme YgiQ (UPF0313 family)
MPTKKIIFLLHNLHRVNFVPLGIASLIGTLERLGYAVHLTCPEKDDLDAEMISFQPDVVAYSMLTGSHNQYIETNRRLKSQFHFITVFGGAHPTFFPEIIAEQGVDAVCIGEGDIAFPEFLERVGTRDVVHTQNFWVKQDGIIYRNPVRPLVPNLDELPMPNYDIFYNSFANLRNNPIKHFMVSRGCPYDCTYCFNHSYSELYKGKGERLRYKSPQYIIREVQSVARKYPLECIYFRDDIFICSRTWLDEFIPAFTREIGLPFICQLRVEMINRELIQRLISAGCVSISLGVETGSEILRNEVLNRKMTNQQIKDACALLTQFQLPFCVNNMVGLPGETIENMNETLSLTQSLHPSYSWFQVFQPYPRTRLSQYATDKGLFDGDFDRVQQSCHEKTALKFAPQHQRMVNNAHKLFALAVEWPWITRFVKALIKIRENKLFIVFFAVGQYYFTTSRLFPMLKMTPGDWLRGFWNTILVTQPSYEKSLRVRKDVTNGH